jgi:hypothetical protein
MFERDRLPFHVAEISETLLHHLEIRPLFLGTPRVPQNTDAGHPFGLLRMGDMRQ